MEYNYIEHQRWVNDNGDKTHRLNYPLSRESVVVDAGGYQGKWSNEILNMYNPRIFIVEPLKSYYLGIIEKFKGREEVSVYNYGLSSREGEIDINLDNDSSSIYKKGEGKIERVKVKRMGSFMKESGIEKINLFKINIEGAEYELLEDIINEGIQNKIENIQVQFHVFIPGCQDRRKKIQENLSKTHECTYNYEFIWENWSLKK
jgi:FkbM family methyltransferase